jgi:hypothetical protein
MSSYHVLTCSEKDHESTVAFHFAVPDSNNSAGVNWRTALKAYRPSPGSAVPNLEADFAVEYAAIQNGEVYEHVEAIPVTATWSNDDKIAALSAAYTSLSATTLARLAAILKYWGYYHDVT